MVVLAADVEASCSSHRNVIRYCTGVGDLTNDGLRVGVSTVLLSGPAPLSLDQVAQQVPLQRHFDQPAFRIVTRVALRASFSRTAGLCVAWYSMSSTAIR